MRKIFRQVSFVLWVILCGLMSGSLMKEAEASEEVVYRSDELALKGYLCKPEGSGPFPAVIYHHGGFGDLVRGSPEETCRAIAREGFVGFSPLRRKTIPIEGNLEDVLAALEFVKRLPYVDPQRVGMIGFSRGGLLTLMAAARRSNVKAIVLMAPAPGKGHLRDVLEEVHSVSGPVLLMVAENDTRQADHVGICRMVQSALKSAGKEVEMILYPPYGRDGHQMFFEVGDYWRDVREFLRRSL